MMTQITDGVTVTVETVYQSEYSNPGNDHFMFAYHITIENLGPHSIQLLRRHWLIYDSSGTKREIDGEGVVGLQPIIPPGEQHDYRSDEHTSELQSLMRTSYAVFSLQTTNIYITRP